MSTYENRSNPAGVILRVLILLIAAAIFGYGAFQMYGYVTENKISDESRDKLAQQSVVILPEVEESPDPVSDLLPSSSQDGEPGTGNRPDLSKTIPLRIDFETLRAENPDIIGWIYCADTPINYPIVQGEDNQYYVNHLVDGTALGSGAIFLDFRNYNDFSDLNSLIYGHNMTNKSMFGSLRYYRDQSYYEEHPVIWIATPEVAYRVDLIAACTTAADSDDYDIFTTQEELQLHLEEMINRSTFRSRVNPSVVSRIVTLSTCTYDYDNARYIVIGNLLPIPYPAEESNEFLAE